MEGFLITKGLGIDYKKTGISYHLRLASCKLNAIKNVIEEKSQIKK